MSTMTKAGKITRREKARLVRAIARAVEVAYRRGFHHGFIAGRDPKADLGHTITARDVSDWRYSPTRLSNSRSHSAKLSPWGHNEMTPLARALDEGPGEGVGNVIREFMLAEPTISEDDLETKPRRS
jgi:hypothetical protein